MTADEGRSPLELALSSDELAQLDRVATARGVSRDELVVTLLREALGRLHHAVTASEAFERHKAEILETARDYGIARLRVFGSIARGEDDFESDIDLLAALPSGTHPGALGEFVERIEMLTGRHVDVVPDDLPGSKYDQIRAEARPV